MIVVVIMGIIATAVIASWQSVIDSRNVTGAANQVAADMRQSHAKATNQLTDWRLVYKIDGSKVTCATGKTGDYCLVRLGGVYESGTPTVTERIARNLPEGVRISTTTTLNADTGTGAVSPSISGTTRTIEFNSDGSVTALSGTTGSPAQSPALSVIPRNGGASITVTVSGATSRIEIRRG